LYRNILVGSDGSVTAQRAVDRAVELASATGARVTIMTVGSAERAGAVVAAEAARVASSGSSVEVVTNIEVGEAAAVLLEEAAKGYDLLVVGNKGMTGASRFFLGSVPNKVSHHAPCATLIVRTT
jgi:nucleotide-binding universal stress UspA family protein